MKLQMTKDRLGKDKQRPEVSGLSSVPHRDS